MDKIEVSKVLIAECKRWAEQRNEQNAGHKDAAHYQDRSALPWSTEEANWYGLLAETAVFQWLGGNPHNKQWVNYRDENGKYPKGLQAKADMLFNKKPIEVRNSAIPTNALTVRRKDVNADARVIQTHVVLDDAGNPTGTIFLVGWINAVTGWKIGEWSEKKQYKKVAHKHKKPIITFPTLGVVS